MPDNFRKEFLTGLDSLVDSFAEVTKMFHERIDEWLDAEGKRLTEELEPPITVGTRVFVNNFGCEGTVTKAWVSVSADDSDYYAPQRGVDSLGLAEAVWVYEVQPDPTPIRKQARDPQTTTSPGILGQPGECYPRSVVAEQPEENDWDDEDDE